MKQHSLADLCDMWNAATAPYVLRTDQEHARQNRLARAIAKRTRDCGWFYGHDWDEWSNGERYPIRKGSRE